MHNIQNQKMALFTRDNVFGEKKKYQTKINAYKDLFETKTSKRMQVELLKHIQGGYTSKCFEREHLIKCTNASSFLLSNLFSYHVCGYKGYFLEIVPLKGSNFELDSRFKNTSLEPRGMGSIALQQLGKSGKWESVVLRNVLYIPGLLNILSYSAIVSQGWFLSRPQTGFQLNKTAEHISIPIIDYGFGVYQLKLAPVFSSKRIKINENMLFFPDELFKLWHLRTGHVPADTVLRTLKIDQSLNHETVDCELCNKHGHISSIYALDKCLNNKLAINDAFYVHVSKKRIRSRKGNTLLVTIQDCVSGFLVAFGASDFEDCINQIISHYQTNVANADNLKKLKILKLYSEETTVSHLVFRLHSIAESVLDESNSCDRQHDAVYSDKDGRAHTFVQVFIKKLIFLCTICDDLWDNLVYTACIFHNVLTFRRDLNMSAHELYLNSKPKYGVMKAIGSSVLHVCQLKPYRTTTSTMIGFVGPDYLVYNQKSRQIFKVKHGVFFEEDLLQFNVRTRNTPATVAAAKPVNSAPSVQLKSGDITMHSLFDKLRLASSRDRSELEHILMPVKETLQNVEDRCSTNLVCEPKLVNVKESHMLDGYRLRFDINQNFAMFQVTEDANNLFSALSVAIFGIETYGLLIRLAVLNHTLKYWNVLHQHSKIFFKVEFVEIIDVLKDNTRQALPSHLLFFSEIIRRAISVHVFDKFSNECYFDLYCLDASRHTKQAIFLSKIDNMYHVLLPRNNSFVKSILQSQILDKSHNSYSTLLPNYRWNGNTQPIVPQPNHYIYNAVPINSTLDLQLLPKNTNMLLHDTQKGVAQVGMHTKKHKRPNLKRKVCTNTDTQLADPRKEPRLNAGCKEIVDQIAFIAKDITEANPSKIIQKSSEIVSTQTPENEQIFDAKLDVEDEISNQKRFDIMDVQQQTTETVPKPEDGVLPEHRRDCPFDQHCKPRCNTEEEMRNHFIMVHCLDKDYAYTTGEMLKNQDMMTM